MSAWLSFQNKNNAFFKADFFSQDVLLGTIDLTDAMNYVDIYLWLKMKATLHRTRVILYVHYYNSANEFY